jgi:HlyD family secretion protein
MKPTMNPEPDITETLEVLPGGGRRKKLKWYLAAGIALVVVIVLFAAVRSGGRSAGVQYKTEEVRRGNLTVTVTATGTLAPKNSVDVGSELSGIIKTVEVNYNSTVKVGQALAKLDTTKLEATIAQSRASLESAKAKVLQAKATVSETRAKLAQYEKVHQLSNGKVPSKLEMDGAIASFERAKADLAYYEAAVLQAEATLRTNETDLSKSVIRSPVNGIVLTRSVEPGQTVAASLQAVILFSLAEDLTQMDLQLNVDEADIGKIQENQKASFSVAAYPNRTFEGRIVQARFGSTTTSGVVTYKTILRVNNHDLALRPGMTATADITVKSLEKVLLIPSAALRFSPPVKRNEKPSGGLIQSILPHPPKPKAESPETGVNAAGKQQQLWILREGRLVNIPITVGAANGGTTEVTGGGLEPGMAVVVDTIAGAK